MQRSNFGVDLGHYSHEFIKVDSSVVVLVGIFNHLINLSRGEVLVYTGGNLLELLSSESSTACGVKGLKDSSEGGLAGIFTSEAKDFKEGSKVNISTVSGGADDGKDLLSL